MYSKFVTTAFSLLIFAKLSTGQNLKDTTQLDSVIIVENRISTAFSAASQNVQIISGKTIEKSPVRSLNEMLSYSPGVDIRQRGPMGSQADISIRGGSFEQTLLLVNGIKLTDPQTGHHGLNIPVPLPAIGHIELLKGPAARIYGQNAFAGAVNIITKPVERFGVDAQVFAGDYNLRGGNLFLALPYKKLKQSFSGSYASSTGHWYNSDFQNSNVMYDGVLKLNAHSQLRAMGAYLQKAMGANGFYSNRFPDQWEATKTALASLGLEQQFGHLELKWRTYYRRNDDEFRLKRMDPTFYTNIHHSDTYAAEMNGKFDSPLGQTGFGVDARNEKINSSNLGNHERTLLGLYAEHKLKFAKRADVRAGVYANYYSQYGLKWFPGFEAGYQLTQHARVYTNTGYSYRIPTYTELYYKDPSTGSNPNLVPEHAASAELGYRYLNNAWRVEFNGFYRHSSNLIDYYRPADGSGASTAIWTPRNINTVNFRGVEFSLDKNFKVSDSLFSVSKVTLSYNYIDAGITNSPGIETRYVLDHLRHQGIASVQLIVFKKLFLNLNGRYIVRQNAQTYFLADVKGIYQWTKSFSAFLELTNLTNTHYLEAGYVQMPGRWLKLGLNYKLST